MDCLNQIIGITKDNCECLQQDLSPEQITELSMSKSGLYLEELEGGVFLRNVAQLDKCKTFIDIQNSAIETAKKHFTKDLFASLNEKYQVKKLAYIGDIGRPTYSGTLDVNKRLQFIKLQPNKESDAIINLQSFRVFLNQDSNVKVWIYSINEGEVIGNIIMETEVQSLNGVLQVPVDRKLSMKKSGYNVTYYIIFERLGSVKPRNINVSCGCSGGDAFAKFVNVSGGEVDGFSSLSTEKTDKFTHGFALDVQIKCETGNLICKEYDQNDAISQMTAFAILYKSGELVIENIMNSGEVNRFTMLSREHLWGKRSHFKSEYSRCVNWLSQAIDVSSSDCFICRTDDFFLGNILN